jgi:hypothetical protein
MFKIGEKVVCIDDSKGRYTGKITLVKGEIYTVIKLTNVEEGGVLLKEIEPMKNDYNSYHYYSNHRFRKIDYSFSEELLEKIKQDFFKDKVAQAII